MNDLNKENEVTKNNILDEIYNYSMETNLDLTKYDLSNNDIYELMKICKRLDVYMYENGIDCTSKLENENN